MYNREENAGMEEPILELTLFPVVWWENGAGAGRGSTIAE
jgi:hypothetical protein